MTRAGRTTSWFLIRFPNPESERRALGYLARCISFKSWKDGWTLVPESALASLEVEGIQFIVEGPATDRRIQSK